MMPHEPLVLLLPDAPIVKFGMYAREILATHHTLRKFSGSVCQGHSIDLGMYFGSFPGCCILPG